jgi:hypothetical protein
MINNKYKNTDEIQNYIYGDHKVDKNLLCAKLKDIHTSVSYFILGSMFDKFNDIEKSLYYLHKSRPVDRNTVDRTMSEIISEMDNMYKADLIIKGFKNKNLYNKLKTDYTKLQTQYTKSTQYITHLLTKPGGDVYKEALVRFKTNDYKI